MNPDLGHLQAYPFEKLAALFRGTTPPASLKAIALSIGEPKHPAPAFVKDILVQHMGGLSAYPTTKGIPELRQAIASWLVRRFNLMDVNEDTQVLPVNGTREALFSFTQAVIDRTKRPLVVMPDPFYQIYEGAALLAGAEPYFLPTTAANGFVPDYDAVPDEVWERCQLLFLCSPGNPTGAVTGRETLRKLVALADRFDFVIASDECYSEIYFDEARPPRGALAIAHALGRSGFPRLLTFGSLSKRSNAPGLRSGYVAGDASLVKPFLLYRTYHGSAMSPAVAAASLAAWCDETHVVANRAKYATKFRELQPRVATALPCAMPDAAFYLWARTPYDDAQFAKRLFAEEAVTVLAGSYLARDAHGENPGRGYVRIALVAEAVECAEAVERIVRFAQR